MKNLFYILLGIIVVLIIVHFYHKIVGPMHHEHTHEEFDHEHEHEHDMYVREDDEDYRALTGMLRQPKPFTSRKSGKNTVTVSTSRPGFGQASKVSATAGQVRSRARSLG
jgi:type II secretory pathway component PulM